jgi:ribonuclease Z
METSRTGTGFAICDLPSTDYLSDFLSSSEWADIEASRRRTGCFFWLLGENVASDLRFRKFVDSFSDAKHIIASPDTTLDRINYKSAAKCAALLSSIDPEIFPQLQLDTVSVQRTSDMIGETLLPGLQWQIEPRWELRSENIERAFNDEEVLEHIPSSLQAAISTYRQRSSASILRDIPGGDVEVYTLGTGSSLPSKHRNVSSTLIRIPQVGSVLLDCGEGTLGQLKRLFTSASGELSNVLIDLKLIYISHLHADHHLGTTSILREKYNLHDEKIYIVAPWVFEKYLTEFALAEPELDVVERVEFVASETLRINSTESEPEK